MSKRENQTNETSGVPTFARKVVDPRNKPVAESLSDLLREIGISRVDETLSIANLTVNTGSVGSPKASMTGSGNHVIKHRLVLSTILHLCSCFVVILL